MVAIGLSTAPTAANAGMIMLPLQQPLKNNIILMRAGESKRDAEGVVETAPVKKLAVTNALTPEGRQQVIEAAKKLCVDDVFGNPPTWIYTSNTERAYESAVILGRECLIGQNRIVPEFSFLDARGLGTFEGQNQEESRRFVHELDEKEGIRWKPPTSLDGTTSDSVDNVLVRIRQLVSALEGIYSGENVVIVSPDSDVLSILQAALASLDPDGSLPAHNRFAFRNGEVRMLESVVAVNENLVTGQTVEEADASNRKYKAMRVAGVARGGAASAAKGFESQGEWVDLYHTAVDTLLENMRLSKAEEAL